MMLLTMLLKSSFGQTLDSNRIDMGDYREFLENNVLEISGEIIIPSQAFLKEKTSRIPGKISVEKEGCRFLNENQSKLEKERMQELGKVLRSGDKVARDELLAEWVKQDEIFSNPNHLSLEELDVALGAILGQGDKINAWIVIEIFKGPSIQDVINFLYLLEMKGVKYSFDGDELLIGNNLAKEK